MKIKDFKSFFLRAYGSILGLGTMLKHGRSRVRFSIRLLEFSFDLILLISQWPWG
jgi:hypothetical protein